MAGVVENIRSMAKRLEKLADQIEGAATSKESWLRSSDHEKFAAAAVRCQHAGAYCIADGFCHRGDCFIQSEASIQRKLERILTEAK